MNPVNQLVVSWIMAFGVCLFFLSCRGSEMQRQCRQTTVERPVINHLRRHRQSMPASPTFSKHIADLPVGSLDTQLTMRFTRTFNGQCLNGHRSRHEVMPAGWLVALCLFSPCWLLHGKSKAVFSSSAKNFCVGILLI